MGLYSLFFFSCLLHSFFYPWQFIFSFTDCIIRNSLSHLFLEIAVQLLVLFLSQHTYFLFFVFLLCLFPLSYCTLPLVSSSYLTQPDRISLWGTADSSQSPLTLW